MEVQTQVIPNPYTADIRSVTAILPAIRRLKPKQRAFVKAFCDDPSSLPRACVSAGYSRLAYRTLLRNTTIKQAMIEEVARLTSLHRNAADVIADIMQVVKNPESSDMAKIRGLELEADLRGDRSRAMEPERAPQQQVSATWLQQAPALASASSTIAALQAYDPDEEERAK